MWEIRRMFEARSGWNEDEQAEIEGLLRATLAERLPGLPRYAREAARCAMLLMRAAAVEPPNGGVLLAEAVAESDRVEIFHGGNSDTLALETPTLIRAPTLGLILAGDAKTNAEMLQGESPLHPGPILTAKATSGRAIEVVELQQWHPEAPMRVPSI